MAVMERKRMKRGKTLEIGGKMYYSLNCLVKTFSSKFKVIQSNSSERQESK